MDFINLDQLGFSGILLVVALTAFIFMILNLILKNRYEEIDKRIQTMQIQTEGSNEEKKLNESLFKRIYMMIEERMVVFLEKNYTRGSMAPLKTKLLQAGDHDSNPIQFRAKVIILCIGGCLLGLIVKDPRLILLFGFLGFYYPYNKLDSKIKKRQMQIKSEIPDFLDLLSATAPSAKNLEDAIKKVCDRSTGVVTEEFSRALEEVNAGRKTRDALTDMAIRCGVEEIKTLVSQINQSEVFGTGVEKTLLVQAEKIRKLKKLMAEIKARKAAVMLLLPSLFLLCTVILIIIGPHIVNIVNSLGNF